MPSFVPDEATATQPRFVPDATPRFVPDPHYDIEDDPLTIFGRSMLGSMKMLVPSSMEEAKQGVDAFMEYRQRVKPAAKVPALSKQFGPEVDYFINNVLPVGNPLEYFTGQKKLPAISPQAAQGSYPGAEYVAGAYNAAKAVPENLLTLEGVAMATNPAALTYEGGMMATDAMRHLPELKKTLTDDKVSTTDKTAAAVGTALMVAAPILGLKEAKGYAESFRSVVEPKRAVDAVEAESQLFNERQNQMAEKMRQDAALVEQAKQAEEFRLREMRAADFLKARGEEMQQAMTANQVAGDESTIAATTPGAAATRLDVQGYDAMRERARLAEQTKLPEVDDGKVRVDVSKQVDQILGVEGWADGVISRRGPGSGALNTLDPELLGAYAVKGGAIAARGVKDFAKWGDEMVAQYGDDVKPHLKAIWAETAAAKQPQVSAMATDEGIQTKSANIGRIVKMMGDKLYSSDTSKTTGKELIQNAVDAVMQQEPVGRQIASGHDSEGHFVIADSGPGMTPEIILNKFLPAGESGKSVGSGGGLGLAKIAILGGNEAWTLVTQARDPSGQGTIRSTLTGTGPSYFHYVENPPKVRLRPGEEIPLADGMTLKYEVVPHTEGAAPPATGTALRIKTKSPYAADDFVRSAMKYQPEVEHVGAYVSDSADPSSPLGAVGFKSLGDGKRGQDLSLLHTIETPYATIDILAPAKTTMSKSEWQYVDVLNRGILQFTKDLTFREPVALPKGVAINIKPKVKADHKDYPFTTNREGIIDAAEAPIKGYFKEIGQRAVDEMSSRYRNAVEQAPKIKGVEGDLVFLDVSEVVPPELVAEVTSNPFVREVVQDVAEIQNAVLKMLRRKYPDETFNRARFAGLITGGRAYGVHFGKPRTTEPSTIYHDPFLTWRDAKEEATKYLWMEHKDAGKEVAAAATTEKLPRTTYEFFRAKIAGVSLHEALHQITSSEGEELARHLTFKAGDLIESMMAVLGKEKHEGQYLGINRTLSSLGDALSAVTTTEGGGDFIISQGGYHGYAVKDTGGSAPRSGLAGEAPGGRAVSGGEVASAIRDNPLPAQAKGEVAQIREIEVTRAMDGTYEVIARRPPYDSRWGGNNVVFEVGGVTQSALANLVGDKVAARVIAASEGKPPNVPARVKGLTSADFADVTGGLRGAEAGKISANLLASLGQMTAGATGGFAYGYYKGAGLPEKERLSNALQWAVFGGLVASPLRNKVADAIFKARLPTGPAGRFVNGADNFYIFPEAVLKGVHDAIKGEAPEVAALALTPLKFHAALATQMDNATAGDRLMVGNYLRGTGSAGNIFDPKLKFAAEQLRVAIDDFTLDMMARGIIEPGSDLHNTATVNLGAYLTRAYRAFEPGYKAAKADINNFVREYVVNELLNRSTVDIPTLRQQGYETALRMVSKGPGGALDAASNFAIGNGIARTDGSIFKPRKNLSDATRRLLGEYADPVHAAGQTLDRMVHYLAADITQGRMREVGLAAGIFSEKATDTHTVPVTMAGKESRGPLTNLWTTPEASDAIKSDQAYRQNGMLWRALATATAASKISKTAHNIVSYAPNFWSSWLNLMSQGSGARVVMHPDRIRDALRVTFDDVFPNDKARLMRDTDFLTREGLLRQNVNLNDLVETMRSSYLPQSMFNKGGGFVRKIAFDWPLNAYGKAEEFPRILGFYLELERAKAIWPQATETELYSRAASATKRVYPNANELPQALRKLSITGAANPFISWQYETFFRNPYNTVRQAMEDIKEGKDTKNPRQVAAGVNRLTWFVGTVAGTIALNQAYNQRNGVGERQEEAIKRMVPKYDRDGLLIINKLTPTEFSYANQSYLVPHSVPAAAVKAALSGVSPADATLAFAKEFYGAFRGDGGVVIGPAIEALSGRNEFGRQIFTQDAGRFVDVGSIKDRPMQDVALGAQNTAERVGHFLKKSLLPGTVNEITKWSKAIHGEVGPDGQLYDTGDLAMRLGGFRLQRLQIPQQFERMAKGVGERLREVGSEYSRVRDRRDSKPEDIDQAYGLSEQARTRIWGDIKTYLEDAKELSQPHAVAIKNLRDGGVSSELILGALNGYYIPGPKAKTLTSQERYDALMAMPQAERAAQWATLMKSEPFVAKAMIGQFKDAAKGVTEEDKLLLGLSVNDGTRARNIARLISLQPNDATKRALYSDLAHKGAINGIVASQLRDPKLWAEVAVTTRKQ